MEFVESVKKGNQSKLGELLRGIVLSKGVIDSQRCNTGLTTLSDYGITKNQSSRAQKSQLKNR